MVHIQYVPFAISPKPLFGKILIGLVIRRPVHFNVHKPNHGESPVLSNY